MYKPYSCYVLEVEVNNPDVPYGDFFYSVARYCLTYETATSCRMVVHARVGFRKSTMLKAMISKLAVGAMRDYFGQMLDCIRQELAVMANADGIAGNPSATLLASSSTSKKPLSRAMSIASIRSSSLGAAAGGSSTDVLVHSHVAETGPFGLLHIRLLLLGAAILCSLVLLLPIVGKMFVATHDGIDRLMLILRCAAFCSVPVAAAFFVPGKNNK